MKKLFKTLLITAPIFTLGVVTISRGLNTQNTQKFDAIYAGMVNPLKDKTPDFVDDFSEYSSFDSLKRNYTNSAITGTGDSIVTCGADVINITNDPNDSSNKVLKIDSATKSHSYTYLTLAQYKIRDFKMTFRYYFGSSSNINDTWFGIMARKEVGRDNSFLNTSGVMLTFQRKPKTHTGTAYAPIGVQNNGILKALTVSDNNNIDLLEDSWHDVEINVTSLSLTCSEYSLTIDNNLLGVVTLDDGYYSRYGNLSFISSCNYGLIDDLYVKNNDTEAIEKDGFVDDMNYTSYESMKSVYGNPFLDNSGPWAETCNNDVFKILDNPKEAGNKSLYVNSAVGNHSFTMLTRKNVSARSFTLNMDYYNDASNNSRGDTWFGIMVRKPVNTDNIFNLVPGFMLLVKSKNGTTSIEVNDSNGSGGISGVTISNKTNVTLKSNDWNNVFFTSSFDNGTSSFSIYVNGTCLGTANSTNHQNPGRFSIISSLNTGYIDKLSFQNLDKHEAVSFQEDFQSYGAYSNMNGKWTNNFLRGNTAATYNSNNVFSIAQAPDNSSNKTLKVNSIGHYHTYVTICDFHPKNFKISFKYYFDVSTPTDDSWFGFMVRKDEIGDERFVDQSCAVAALQYKAGSWSDCKAVGHYTDLLGKFHSNFYSDNQATCEMIKGGWNNIVIEVTTGYDVTKKNTLCNLSFLVNNFSLGTISIPSISLHRYGNVSIVSSNSCGYFDDISIVSTDLANKGESFNITPIPFPNDVVFDGSDVYISIDLRGCKLATLSFRDPLTCQPMVWLEEGKDFELYEAEGVLLIKSSFLRKYQNGKKYLVIKTGDGIRSGGLYTMTITINC